MQSSHDSFQASQRLRLEGLAPILYRIGIIFGITLLSTYGTLWMSRQALPQNNYLIITPANGQLWLQTSDGKRVRALNTMPASNLGAAWNEDGSQIVYTVNGALYHEHVSGRDSLHLWGDDSLQASSPPKWINDETVVFLWLNRRFFDDISPTVGTINLSNHQIDLASTESYPAALDQSQSPIIEYPLNGWGLLILFLIGGIGWQLPRTINRIQNKI